MELKSLGYVGVASRDLTDWPDYAVGFLGMQPVDAGAGSLAFRMDDRKQRLIVEQGDRGFFGWEVDDAAALNHLAARLDAAGVAVRHEPAALADRRCVSRLISFHDPIGNRLEAFCGARIADEAFRPGRAISGFRTGPLGMGHAVLTVENVETLMPFYRDLLGFRLSDYALRPFRAFFFHLNNRHHSLAMVESGTNGLHHLMVELFMLDDVGQGYDIAQSDPGRVAVTMGRHTNDYMTSFYTRSPGGFMFEYGWGGRDIEPAGWEPREYTLGPSLWGHDRDWLPPDKRAEARSLRMRAAIEGERQRVQVLEGNYRPLRGTCPWWDATMARDDG
jgi:2,3-dihydroxybiphenyl 1,2-dioxygenase